MLRVNIFHVNKQELREDESLKPRVLEYQLHHFKTDVKLDGLYSHFRTQEDVDVFKIFEKQARPHEPNQLEGVEVGVSFKDVIDGMMNLDPGKRLTASEALAHPWFSEDPDDCSESSKNTEKVDSSST